MARLLIVPLLLLMAAAVPARAQSFSPVQRAEIVSILRDALRSDPGILRDALASLQASEAQAQDAAVRSAILARRTQLLADGSDPVLGDPGGDVSIAYFYDTRCPYCRSMVPVLADLMRAEPRVRIVFKDLPILGPASQIEARALLAAQRQGQYGRMQDAIMHQTGQQPTTDTLRQMAERLGLDGARLVRDMADPALQAKLDANVSLARDLQLQGTPAIVIGSRMFPGAVELPVLRQAIADARTH